MLCLRNIDLDSEVQDAQGSYSANSWASAADISKQNAALLKGRDNSGLSDA